MNLRPILQLIRFPNIFTALADILLAALAAHALPGGWQPFLLVALASACLYGGGMVWNDLFDLEQDKRERPFRPLPSERVSRRTAVLLGLVLLAAGMGLAALAGATFEDCFHWAPVLLAGILVGAIFLYDGWLKRTGLGPVSMGFCRFLNVLLGLTAAGNSGSSWGVYLALVVGLYITGVTWFARTEARSSTQGPLVGAAMVMLSSLLLALPLPTLISPAQTASLFPYYLVALGFLVGIPLCRAIVGPTPSHVQAAVKRSLLGLVVLDATLATAFAGTAGLAILLLLVPILLLGRWRWLYAT